ncbi:MAG: hypothetical protein IPO59_09000 [Betaproteobacteria bacterium]|nr:hypothetical protein [Betaproteobacteria bacterium]
MPGRKALLRIPDDATRDALIRDKIADGNWHQHLGRRPVTVRQRRGPGPCCSPGSWWPRTARAACSRHVAPIVARGGEPSGAAWAWTGRAPP